MVPLTIAISLKRAAVSLDIEKVMLVLVFSSLPCGFVKKCPTFRFLISPHFRARFIPRRDAILYAGCQFAHAQSSGVHLY